MEYCLVSEIHFSLGVVRLETKGLFTSENFLKILLILENKKKKIDKLFKIKFFFSF